MLSRRLLPLVLLLALLAGCSTEDAGSAVPRLSAYGVDRDQAIVLSGGQPRTLDPALTLGGPDGPLGHIFGGLVTLDTNLQVQPDLAAGWQVSDDGRTYTFYLHPQARFHDGRPVMAQDVIFSWERATDPALGSDTAQTYLGDIQGVDEKLSGEAETISGLRAIDERTLEVQLEAPVVYFLAKLTYPVTFVVDAENVSEPDWEYTANGTGPFELQAWEDDEIIVLARDEDYHNGPAQVAHVVYDLGAGLPLSLYETDRIDLVGVGGDTLERVQDPNNPLANELRTTVDMCTSVIGLNSQLPPFDDARVRQAFNLALDRERLLDTFGGDNVIEAWGSLPPGMPGYGGLEGQRYPYDTEQARALLAEAGYADPADLGPLTYTTLGFGDVGPYITAVITLWQEALGVTIEPVLVEPFEYYDQLFAGNAGHFYTSSWCADYPDPQNFLDVLYHSESRQNVGGFADPEIDALLQAARVEEDVDRRLAMYQEAERLIVEQAPAVFVSHGISAVLVKPYLQNYVLTPIGVAQWQRVRLAREE